MRVRAWSYGFVRQAYGSPGRPADRTFPYVYVLVLVLVYVHVYVGPSARTSVRPSHPFVQPSVQLSHPSVHTGSGGYPRLTRTR
ncbi:hypothetical protein ACWD3Z_05670 [Streptomyces sp. NPDC002740]